MSCGDLQHAEPCLLSQGHPRHGLIQALNDLTTEMGKEPYPDAPTLDTRTPRGQDVQSSIMYSPSTSVRGINATGILNSLKALPVSVYVVASKDENSTCVTPWSCVIVVAASAVCQTKIHRIVY
jgi:hypothetical protein